MPIRIQHLPIPLLTTLLSTLTIIPIKLTTAQSIPTCATTCLTNNLLSQTACPQMDTPCLCRSDSYITAVFSCVQVACEGSQRDQAVEYAVNLCRTNGVEVSVPTTSVTSIATSSTGTQRTTATSGSEPTDAEGGSTPTSNSNSNSDGNGKNSGTENEFGDSPSSAGSGSTPVGAIVGGVVGGMAAIGLVLVGVWLVMRHRRRSGGNRGFLVEEVEKAGLEMERNRGNGGDGGLMPSYGNGNAAAGASGNGAGEGLGIWSGEGAYSWDPRRDVRDVQAGTAEGLGRPL